MLICVPFHICHHTIYIITLNFEQILIITTCKYQHVTAAAEQETGYPSRRQQPTRQEATPGLEWTDQSEDSIRQNTTYTSCLIITFLLLEGEPGSAYKVHKQWCYILPPILYLHMGAADILYLYPMHSHILHCITPEIFALHSLHHQYSLAWFAHLMGMALAQ